MHHKIIGLTGPTGAGKSTVAREFEKFSVDVIDADKIAHEVISVGTPCYNEVIKNFKNIVNKDKSINRSTLGSIVFSDKDKLKLLENIIFPYIIEEIDKRIQMAKKVNKPVLIDAPTLIESGFFKRCDVIIVVTANDLIRLERIMNRDNISLEYAKKRLESQLANEEYLKYAHYVINTDNGLYNINKIIKEILK
jgi:dephospho-CoA kinase